MRNDLCDLTVVMDRSGSMASVRDEAVNGLNRFVAEQKKQDGHCLFTMVQFDTHYEFVHRAVPIGEVPALDLKPRGMTALLDAVGRAINETGERLAAMPEAERPGLVVFVILTDGHENASREFTPHQVREMIARQEKEYSWQFTYLGANQDAFASAAAMEIPTSGALNYAQDKTSEALAAASANVCGMRCATSKGLKAQNMYTDQQRNSVV